MGEGTRNSCFRLQVAPITACWWQLSSRTHVFWQAFVQKKQSTYLSTYWYPGSVARQKRREMACQTTDLHYIGCLTLLFSTSLPSGEVIFVATAHHVRFVERLDMPVSFLENLQWQKDLIMTERQITKITDPDSLFQGTAKNYWYTYPLCFFFCNLSLKKATTAERFPPLKHHLLIRSEENILPSINKLILI